MKNATINSQRTLPWTPEAKQAALGYIREILKYKWVGFGLLGEFPPTTCQFFTQYSLNIPRDSSLKQMLVEGFQRSHEERGWNLSFEILVQPGGAHMSSHNLRIRGSTSRSAWAKYKSETTQAKTLSKKKKGVNSVTSIYTSYLVFCHFGSIKLQRNFPRQIFVEFIE